MCYPVDPVISSEQPGPELGQVFSKIRPAIPRGLVVRIRRSHRHGLGSIPGVGICAL